ncbi:unnamed protein product [Closterium sp. Naga37s-1]|nr:unnamed protein product [Closterium sp. Naga37s-1]
MPIIMTALNRGIQFYTFETVKAWLLRANQKHPKTFQLPDSLPPSSVAGGAAGLAATLLLYPFSAVGDHMSLQPGKYPGLRQALVGVAQQHGASQLFRGVVPKLASMVPASAINFLVFESLKEEIKRLRNGKDPSAAHMLISGAIAGAASTIVTHPFELCRREINMSLLPKHATPTGGHLEYNSLRQAMRGILRKEGVRGLYRGVLPSLIELVPATAIGFLVYEMGKRVMVAEGQERRDEVDFKWTSSSTQLAAKAALVVVESPTVKDEVPAVPVAVPAGSFVVPAACVVVPAVSVAVPADLLETATSSAEPAALSTLVVPPVSAVTPRCSAEEFFGLVENSICSVEEAWWLAPESEEVASWFLVAEVFEDVIMGLEAQKGVELDADAYEDATMGSEARKGVEMKAEVGAEASSRRCSLSQTDSSCSSHSACLIDPTWDSCSSTSADSLCGSHRDLVSVVTCGKKGIGRRISGTGKGWIMDMRGSGKADGGTAFSNQLFGDDEEDEDASSRSGSSIYGAGSVCYMNQLYMDEEDEEERRSLAASGISLGKEGYP